MFGKGPGNSCWASSGLTQPGPFNPRMSPLRRINALSMLRGDVGRCRRRSGALPRPLMRVELTFCIGDARKQEIRFRWRDCRSLGKQRHQFIAAHPHPASHAQPFEPMTREKVVAQRRFRVLGNSHCRGGDLRRRGCQQLSHLLDLHLRVRIGNARAVIEELASKCGRLQCRRSISCR